MPVMNPRDTGGPWLKRGTAAGVQERRLGYDHASATSQKSGFSAFASNLRRDER